MCCLFNSPTQNLMNTDFTVLFQLFSFVLRGLFCLFYSANHCLFFLLLVSIQSCCLFCQLCKLSNHLVYHTIFCHSIELAFTCQNRYMNMCMFFHWPVRFAHLISKYWRWFIFAFVFVRNWPLLPVSVFWSFSLDSMLIIILANVYEWQHATLTDY